MSKTNPGQQGSKKVQCKSTLKEYTNVYRMQRPVLHGEAALGKVYRGSKMTGHQYLEFPSYLPLPLQLALAPLSWTILHID